MIFTEPIFFAFFAVVLAAAWGAGSHRRHKLWLLAASYLFYAAWDWRFLSLIVGSTLVDYAVGLGLGRTEAPRLRRALLLTSLGVNLGLLATFKYFGFFVESAVGLLSALGLEPASRVPEIVLPVGISFYTFQTLSYTIDIYRRSLAPVRDLADFALFVSFFPQLVAGPIVRASTFLPQLRKRPRWGDVAGRRSLQLFLLGFFKKACVADNLAPFVDRVFESPELFTAGASWLAVLLYAVQIYCDFSGYSQMAIGAAGLLGYRLPRNFAHPYLAASLAEFWHRWHITLSTWLRDYLYIPLGGSRDGRRRTARNLLITMVLGGLWHGAAWTFVVWGLMHGAALVAHRAWRRLTVAERLAAAPAWRAPAVVLTLAWVCLTWVYFRAQSFSAAWTLTRRILFLEAGGPLELPPALWAFLAAFALAHAVGSRLRATGAGPLDLLPARARPAWLRSDAAFAAAYGAAAAVTVFFLPLRTEAFIYFQF